MRLAALQLLAYGHFTDRHLELVRRDHDLHILFGANEAGKSTARSAISDFLFGFPGGRSDYAFRHDNPKLRIGARLETAQGHFSALRRKGHKNTLLDEQGQADPQLEARVEQLLAGVDKDFFTRMFSLDHEQLRDGGDMLARPDASGDNILLAAGSGLADILGQREQLAREANALWAPTRAQNREFYRARDLFQQAHSDVQAHTVSVEDWQARRQAWQQAEDHYQDLLNQQARLEQRRTALERIRRVAPQVQRYLDLQRELAELASTPRLPADARQRYESAEQTRATAQSRLDTLATYIDKAWQGINAIADEPALRAQAQAINWLAGQFSHQQEIRAELTGLEQRQAQARQALTAACQQLGWSRAPQSWPTSQTLDQTRQLQGRQDSRLQALQSARDNQRKLEQRQQQLQVQYQELAPINDTQALQAWLGAVTQAGDLEERIRHADQDRRQQEADLAQALAALEPKPADDAPLADLPVPDSAQVANQKEEFAHLEAQLRSHQQRIEALTDEVERTRQSLERDQQALQIPTPEELAAKRRQRDQYWQQLRQRYITRGEPDLFTAASESSHPSEALSGRQLERLTREADDLADQRFAHVQTMAQQAQKQSQLAERQDALAQARQRWQQYQDSWQQKHGDWQKLWQACGITPYHPTAMQSWLQQRQQILRLENRCDQSRAQLQQLQQQVSDYWQAGRSHLEQAGLNSAELDGLTLSMLAERARQLIDTARQQQRERERLAEDARQLSQELQQAENDLDKARQAYADWQEQWQNALATLGLAADLEPDTAALQLAALASGQAAAAELADLNHRQAQLQNQQAQFQDQLAQTLQSTGQEQQTAETGENCAARLQQLLTEAQRRHQELQTHQNNLADYRQQQSQLQEELSTADTQLRQLARQAGIDDISQLSTVIQRAETRQQLEQEKTRLERELTAQGDGLGLSALIDTVQNSDLAQIKPDLTQLDARLADLKGEIATARDQRNAARQDFDAIGGDDRAARAATEKQLALTDISNAAERYLRVGTAATLLKWVSQRYALDKHRPLIERGSTLMNHLTGGSFQRLTGEFDARDELQIMGVRADGSPVPPSGMSEGSRDQLYLALRIAAIEDYLQRAPALPVVADDLFINFDDERSLAGLEVLASLARQTQVLFFTHHQHLRTMAARQLGNKVQTHDL